MGTNFVTVILSLLIPKKVKETPMMRLNEITITETNKFGWSKNPLGHMGFENSPKCPPSFPFSDIFMQKKALTGDPVVVSQAERRKDRSMQ